MRRLYSVIGLLLVVGSISGLIYWETKGRDALLLDSVLVAKEYIPAGTVMTRDLFSEAGILEENRIQGALDPEMLPQIIGRVAVQGIIKNGQISEEYLAQDHFYLKRNDAVFVIPSAWITMRSSSVRRGDWIDIYNRTGDTKIGTYRIAFVKDANETEVADGGSTKVSQILDRIAATSVISHIEIVTNIREYAKIAAYALSEETASLLLVQNQEVGR